MNVVKIMGGLGNQLFQYAFARSLERYGDVALDLSFYSSLDNKTEIIPPRKFMLDKFNCHYKIADDSFIPINRVTEEEYDGNTCYKDTYFDGYWQKVSLFKDIEDIIKHEITLKDEYITEEMRHIAFEMQHCDSVAIHVRRSDYVQLGHKLELDYYMDAIELVKQSVKHPVFYVFSDNISWCKGHFPSSFHFVSIGDYQDFYLMAQARNNIISNSTYSFWASYLNKNRFITVAPRDWKGIPSLFDERGNYK